MPSQGDEATAKCKIPENFQIGSTELFEILISSKLNMWQVDCKTNAVIDFGFSESLSTLAGCTSGQDKLETFFTRVHPDDLATVKAALEASYETLQDYKAEFRIKLLNGATEWVYAQGKYIFDEKGDPLKIIGIWQFITEQKNRQQMLYQQAVTLDRLSRSYFAGELTSTITHQISQPLSAINTYITGAIRCIENSNLSSADMREILNAAHDQVKTLYQVIKRIRRFILFGELNYQKVCLASVVKDAIMVLILPTEFRVDISCQMQPNMSEIAIDRSQIKQVLHNLLNNSIEAMFDAGVLLPAIKIEVKEEDGYQHISIGDTGPGISDDALARLFTPFYSTKSEGMGIGLSLSQQIIQRHGGALTVRRKANEQGTIVHLKLPITREG